MRADPAPEKLISMYESAARIQPRRAKGRFQKLRVLSMTALLGLFYVVPWLQWSGHPLVWFDLPHRRFHLAGLTLVPQDLFLLSILLLVAAMTLFLFTNILGRVWCGFACPQTVWTEAFLWIEHLCEGDRHARLQLDRERWNTRKILRRGSKHALWAGFALFTGLSFVAYFVPARELFPAALQLQLGGWTLFWSLFYGFTTWGNAGFMREQVCKYMCPYARFQSAMFDRDTQIIAYLPARGEPRKSLAKKQKLPAGDCTDCSLCVQVCPVGIDIRKGLQYECIACAACVDACDSVMDAIGKPRGLIRYTSENQSAGRPHRWLRPRAIGYAAVWLAALVGLGLMLGTRSPVKFDVLRDRHTLVRERANGALENLYTFKLTNEDDRAHRFRLDARLDDGTAMEVIPASIAVERGLTTATPVTLRLPPRQGRLPTVVDVSVRATAEDAPDRVAHRDVRFVTSDGASYP